MSGDFQGLLYAITIQYRLVQTDLFGNNIDLGVEWVFISVFPASKLGIDRIEWRKVLTDSETLNEI